MEHILEGIEILTRHNIPYMVERGESPESGIVKMPDKTIDNLRGLGFRVGKEIIQGGQVVFFRGKLFGMTMG